MSQQPKTYQGEYVAEVVNVNDPKHWMRVQVRVFDIFDDVPTADLPWATYKLPFGVRPTDGGMTPVQVGDQVWVDFPFSGDTRHPRITGGVHFIPEGKPNLPAEMWQGPGQVQHKRTPDEPTPSTPGYHEDVVFKQHGVLVQLTKQGSLRATQLSSGSALEICPDGSIVAHSERDIYYSATGNCLFDVKGNYELRVGGNMTQTAAGAGMMQSKGSMSVGSSAESLNLAAAQQGSMSGPGGLTFAGPSTFKDNIDVGGDVKAGGSVIDAGGNTSHHSH